MTLDDIATCALTTMAGGGVLLAAYAAEELQRGRRAGAVWRERALSAETEVRHLLATTVQRGERGQFIKRV